MRVGGLGLVVVHVGSADPAHVGLGVLGEGRAGDVGVGAAAAGDLGLISKLDGGGL